MCGIAGVYDMRRSAQVSRELIAGMIGVLAHRGPDGSGIYLDDHAGLGHARLSIIDLAGGGQPIHNEDETLWIVYNGELFNYPEIRAELLRKGHRFYTQTDTEVILHLFEDQGPRCLDVLNGQFAFAIWNAATQELFLARDRFGILPLHYTVVNERLFFASEVKSLFTVPGIERRIDPVAMEQVFTLWTTLPGRTLFRNVLELPAGHYAIASKDGVQMRRYWEVPFSSPDRQNASDLHAATEELRQLIVDAIRIRLRADVPVGCYVSGGLDSSAITAVVKQQFNNDLRTFGIRFEEKGYDEGEYQEHLVRQLGTDHTSLLALNEDIHEKFQDILWYCERPLLRTAPVPLYLLSGEVRRHGYKVVLTGEGADEVFGGYDIFREAKILKFWAEEPASTARPLLFSRIYPYIFPSGKGAQTFVRSFFKAGLDAVNDPLFSHLVRWNTTGRTRAFFSPELQSGIGQYSVLDDVRQHLPAFYRDLDYLSKAQYLEIAIFLSNYLLSSQGDRVAMANSVELRPPFLDHRIAEFMGRVPARWKIRGLNEKYLLKQAVRDRVPDRILQRQKHPYRAPIRRSLAGKHTSYLDAYLSESALRKTGLFEPSRVQRLVAKLRSDQGENETDNMAIAGIVSSQIIHDRFIARCPSTADRGASQPELVFDRRAGAGQAAPSPKGMHV